MPQRQPLRKLRMQQKSRRTESMDKITVTAKTYDEAITKALIGLQTTSDHMVVDIIEKGSAGLFGMIGARPWTIQARVKTEEEEAAEQKAAAEKAAAEKKAAQEKAAAEKKAAQEKAAAEKKAAQEKAAKEKAAQEKAAQEKAAAEKKAAQEKAPAEKKAAPEKKKTPSEKPAKKNAPAKQEGDQEAAKKEGKPEGRRQRDKKRGGKDGEGRNGRGRQDRAALASVLPGKRREEHVGREVLQPEADEIKAKAVEFLTQIFRVMDEEISIDTDFNYQDNELNVMMSGDDMGVLIGKRGQTLDSLQYLVSLVVNKHRDVYIRVKLDTENYRERREQKLKSLARNIAHKVKRTRRPMSLEPMNPYERRIIHSALQRDPYVTTYSEGEDPYRHIIVVLKKDLKRQNRAKRADAGNAGESAEFGEAYYAAETEAEISGDQAEVTEIIEAMVDEAVYQDNDEDIGEEAVPAEAAEAEAADSEKTE